MERSDLSKPFDLITLKKLVSGLVETEFYSEARTINYISEVITNTVNIGHFLDNRFQNILVVNHKATVSARVKLATDTFKLMAENNIDKALVAYVSSIDSSEWRFSYVSILLEESKGKIKRSFSNPRRYSYQLGSHAKIQTPFRYLVQKGQVDSVIELQERFSLEVVNREFYKYIASLYQALVGSEKTPLNSEELKIIEKLTKVDHVSTENSTKYYSVDKLIKYPGSMQDSHEFSVRLIGRIIFCWFLREKRSDSGKSLIPIEILSRNAADQSDYYHSVLAPLFFEVLNKPVKNRSSKFTRSEYEKIPYLNGGLFSDDSVDHYKFDKLLELSVHGLVEVPDKWLHHFFDLLERFNFTVDENTSYDTDLSIDPEMLGRVFENLLARINPETGETVRRSTGSFYTPREIVEYMVDTSLIEYLSIDTSISRNKLEALVSYDLTDDVGNELNETEGVKVLEALSTLTILDPACGSGAYPMGILQKIVYVIAILDPSAKWWLAKQLSSASPELRREYENKGVDYIRKLGIIRQTIFGVDIQPIATEISRLRCFLTLIVDEAIDDSQENRGIRPLPNLEFKFVTANTLHPLPEQRFKTGHIQQDIFDNSQQTKIDKLRILIGEFFSASAAEKSEIKAEYRYIQNQLWNDMHESSSYGQQSLALSGWDPFEHSTSGWFDSGWMYGVDNGFDIVIGNPPYVQLQKNGGELADIYKDMKYKTFVRSGDIYSLFYERGLELTKNNSGLLCYITSNKWMRAAYGEKTRSYFNSKNPLKLIDFGGFKVFDSASVDTNIILIQNTENEQKLAAAHFKNNYKKDQPIKSYFKENIVILDELSNDIWVVAGSNERALKGKIDAKGKPIKQWNLNINRGVLTGLNEAFIINKETKTKLIKEDEGSSQIIRPLIRGRNIKRYGIEDSGNYLITTFPVLNLNIDDYPSVKAHLESFGVDRLEQSGKILDDGTKSRKKTGNKWFETQDQIGYYRDFEGERVVWPETMRIHRTDNPDFPRFNIKEKGVYLDKTVFMMDFPRPKYFIGLINSKVGWKIIDQYVDKLDKGGYMMQKAMVETLPIPDPNIFDQDKVNELESLVEKMLHIRNNDASSDIRDYEDKVNRLVYEMYEFTPEEIGLIENNA
jgi:hypothetical protein